MPELRDLPVSITKFATIRGENYIYADKTEFLYNLLQIGRPCFLSRPSGFGKALLLDTLENILRGRRELFRGLWIDGSDYDWTPNPVFRLSLTGVNTASDVSVKIELIYAFRLFAEKEGLSLIDDDDPSTVFKALFDDLYDKYGRPVAVLIHGYDAPVLDQLHQDPELAEVIGKTLDAFYETVKAMDERRGFTFFTGEARYNPDTLLSTFDNLHDLTYEGEYAAICGFTPHDLDSLFHRHMETFLRRLISDGRMSPGSTVSDLRQDILDWCDGYSWDGKTRVLNPRSILWTFRCDRFFDFVGPRFSHDDFLSDLVKTGLTDLKAFKAEESITENRNVIEHGKVKPIPVLFRCGYLTVDRVDESKRTAKYFLKIPNLKTKADLISRLFSLENIENALCARQQAEAMVRALTNLDAKGFKDSFANFIGCFAIGTHAGNDERYHAYFRAAMLMAGQEIQTKGPAGGRYYARFQGPDGTWFIIGIKYCPLEGSCGIKDPVVGPTMMKAAGEVMKWIEKRDFAKRHRGMGQGIYKVALVLGGKSEAFALFKEETPVA
ncbi:MAG: AAA family ATPase [Deltaproteobacteria bacterium]|jgi:hypothetical protein|nr:AAA family ATPase [Deltaproteobacteria bacterium]